ncbi:hypothetical protein NDU88_002432 [Pleurodeles waltl]|uniref:Uncharacterized protein n=1 Tax=Pleurodeles waltl TaxID=8319 RepID=A0AAV7NM09_PLEWA|nr:hypothetical protein NDU88_002432 [Pleurodeles waltl]
MTGCPASANHEARFRASGRGLRTQHKMAGEQGLEAQSTRTTHSESRRVEKVGEASVRPRRGCLWGMVCFGVLLARRAPVFSACDPPVDTGGSQASSGPEAVSWCRQL